MRPSHLLAVSLAFCTMSALGQVQSTGNSAVHSEEATASATPAAGQVRATPRDADESSTPDDPIKAQSQSRKQLIKFLDAQRDVPGFVPGSDLRSDTTCFFIRSYRMVRDDPHSDLTHRDGSTTCVPSARFRVYTTQESSHGDSPRRSEP